MKKYSFENIKVTFHDNGFPKGIVLKRELTARECFHILRDLLGIEISTSDEFDTRGEYEEYRDDVVKNVNGWLTGDVDESVIVEYMWDCQDEPLGLINMITILDYLKKKQII